MMLNIFWLQEIFCIIRSKLSSISNNIPIGHAKKKGVMQVKRNFHHALAEKKKIVQQEMTFTTFLLKSFCNFFPDSKHWSVDRKNALTT